MKNFFEVVSCATDIWNFNVGILLQSKYTIRLLRNSGQRIIKLNLNIIKFVIDAFGFTSSHLLLNNMNDCVEYL